MSKHLLKTVQGQSFRVCPSWSTPTARTEHRVSIQEHIIDTATPPGDSILVPDTNSDSCLVAVPASLCGLVVGLYS